MYSSSQGYLRGHLRGTVMVGRPLIDQKVRPFSQLSLKSNEKAVSGWDRCAFVDLSAISPLRWTHLGFIERSMRDHRDQWDPWALLEHSLSIHWAFIECSYPRWSLRDCFGQSWNFEETIMTGEITGWSLRDHCEIVAIAGRERSLRDVVIFLHHSTITHWSQPPV